MGEALRRPVNAERMSAAPSVLSIEDGTAKSTTDRATPERDTLVSETDA